MFVNILYFVDLQTFAMAGYQIPQALIQTFHDIGPIIPGGSIGNAEGIVHNVTLGGGQFGTVLAVMYAGRPVARKDVTVTEDADVDDFYNEFQLHLQCVHPIGAEHQTRIETSQAFISYANQYYRVFRSG